MSQTLNISVQIRLAKGKDLLLAQGVMKMHQPYYVLNNDLETFSGVHVTDKFHSYQVLKELFDKNRIYVPVTHCSDHIDYNLKQIDLKAMAEKNELKQST